MHDDGRVNMSTKHGHNEHGDPPDPQERARRAWLSVIRPCRGNDVDPSLVAEAVIGMSGGINPAGSDGPRQWQLEEATDGRR